MTANPIVTLSADAQLAVKLVGEEKTPVIVIDDYAKDCAPVLQHACQQNYTFDKSGYYPGLRAPAPKSYVFSLLKSIYETLRDVYAVPSTYEFKPRLGYYSLVSLPPEELSLLQRIPHFDSNNSYYLAVLHYLNPGNFGGTAFFRHKPTGFERIGNARVDEYIRSVQDCFSHSGEPESKYIAGNTEQYEICDTVDYQQNRLVIYPGSLLHSGMVDPSVDVNADPQSGRLTGNIFVEFY